ncbi:DUF775 domain protein [Drepanopeziza brunnea f. sp. 'multigermtubi' MB_m1]|uniref:DUF775 domain protein n=2 Tax=Drepanopeziza brunnea f. sp. 'multigermtubi' TaxID=698441 RepID=K1WPN9_MARBU|nr:DUF775 domain protein [Drepanopeziza brunnea f. sp. 'multigermtubi' MB_m1]EKD14946.1 DUF775 domain protein [Drepanopeziza brunnea f. sp. 'multigermtubi' MB_m1]
MADPLPQLFGVIPTGAPCITMPSAVPSATSFVFTLPTTKPFSHIVVFLLPGITLPPDTAAAVYISLSPLTATASLSFKFLGGIGPGKESAVFKISGLSASSSSPSGPGETTEVDMDADETIPQTGDGEITLGISLETAESVGAQMAALQQQSSSSSSTTSFANSQALVLAGHNNRSSNSKGGGKPETLVLAQRIIKNAFNFLASFSGNLNGGVEVVPLKAFEDWWRKFEGRVRNDPDFLERAEGD